jgi:hypothetical protein
VNYFTVHGKFQKFEECSPSSRKQLDFSNDGFMFVLNDVVIIGDYHSLQRLNSLQNVYSELVTAQSTLHILTSLCPSTYKTVAF